MLPAGLLRVWAGAKASRALHGDVQYAVSQSTVCMCIPEHLLNSSDIYFLKYFAKSGPRWPKFLVCLIILHAIRPKNLWKSVKFMDVLIAGACPWKHLTVPGAECLALPFSNWRWSLSWALNLQSTTGLSSISAAASLPVELQPGKQSKHYLELLVK